MTALITDFPLSQPWSTALAPCIDDQGERGAVPYEWPNNVLSQQTVVYESGQVTRADQRTSQRVDARELEHCALLSAELATAFGNGPLGMRSEADSPCVPYFRVAEVGAAPADSIDEAWVGLLGHVVWT